MSKQAATPRRDHRQRHVSGGFPRKTKPIVDEVVAESEVQVLQPKVRILVGHTLARLREIPENSVHCAITSPPYWGLRDYKVEPQIWGGDPKCKHNWDPKKSFKRGGQTGGTSSAKVAIKGQANFQHVPPSISDTCAKCGAWRGSLGLEPTIEMFIAHIVEVFREVRRVLRPDGVLWLNIGDSYSRQGGGKEEGIYEDKRRKGATAQLPAKHFRSTNVPQTKNPKVDYPVHAKIGSSDGAVGRGDRPGMHQGGGKPKDLLMIPARVALALQAAGWYLRSDVIWFKQNAMPESIIDRPTSAHEHIFMFAKSQRYFFDQEAVRRDPAPGATGVCSAPPMDGYTGGRMVDGNRSKMVQRKYDEIVGGNIRNVWTINTEPFPGAHFATFPTKLVDTCIKAATSEKGCCSKCGAPWIRIMGKRERTNGRGSGNTERSFDHGSNIGYAIPWEPMMQRVLGWEPSCKCNAPTALCTVLDPFGGSGTVGYVAEELRRNAILCELNPEYAKMAEHRIAGFFVDVERT